jgi:hypothetical protein
MVMYVVCFTILGHLVAGMLAGYALLADRTKAEVLPEQRVSVLTVRNVNDADRHRIEELLHSRDAMSVSVASEREGARKQAALD